MEKIAFIGSYDKTDMITYVARLLTIMGKNVLIIDSTALQKTRYIIPTMRAERQYITTFDRIDIAIGFENIQEIQNYKKTEENGEFNYDYILVEDGAYHSFRSY